jgi:hypothetical protein
MFTIFEHRLPMLGIFVHLAKNNSSRLHVFWSAIYCERVFIYNDRFAIYQKRPTTSAKAEPARGPPPARSHRVGVRLRVVGVGPFVRELLPVRDPIVYSVFSKAMERVLAELNSYKKIKIKKGGPKEPPSRHKPPPTAQSQHATGDSTRAPLPYRNRLPASPCRTK